jgi:uncharacterized repeat protein (TIGR04076 family)
MERRDFFGCAGIASVAALAGTAAESMVACCTDGYRPVSFKLERMA